MPLFLFSLIDKANVLHPSGMHHVLIYIMKYLPQSSEVTYKLHHIGTFFVMRTLGLQRKPKILNINDDSPHAVHCLQNSFKSAVIRDSDSTLHRFN
jgi:hypothetical protein